MLHPGAVNSGTQPSPIPAARARPSRWATWDKGCRPIWRQPGAAESLCRSHDLVDVVLGEAQQLAYLLDVELLGDVEVLIALGERR
jgi:hypothetical protein